MAKQPKTMDLVTELSDASDELVQIVQEPAAPGAFHVHVEDYSAAPGPAISFAPKEAKPLAEIDLSHLTETARARMLEEYARGREPSRRS